MAEYKQRRISGVDKKPRYVILDEEGIVIDKSPSKERLESALLWNLRYNKSGICIRCREENDIRKDSILEGDACREKDKDGNKTGYWICKRHWKRNYERYDHNSQSNIKKRLRNCRTGYQHSKHSCTKGDIYIDVACELYGYDNLNDIYDKYNTEIDCICRKTGLFYQVKGRLLRIIRMYITTKGEKRYYEGWNFGEFERELHKEYEDMVCFCKSKDGKMIERIYRFPKIVIDERAGITIMRDNITGWYEQYRVKDLEELRRANEILQKILKK